MNTATLERELVELHRLMRESRARETELLRTSREAIADSHALLREIDRRHPDIDFDAPPRDDWWKT